MSGLIGWRGIFAVMALSVSVARCSAETTLVKPGHDTVWKYFDKDSEPKPEWRNADFDDGAWTPGTAPLGYGEKGLSTTIGFGGDANAKLITAYFRHSFDATAGSLKEINKLRFLVRSDDGVAVYLNGKEVLRHNLPDGALSIKTTATTTVDGVEERFFHRFDSNPSALVAGKNVLAVEVHQSSAASSDLVLDLMLKSYNTGEDLRPLLSAQAKTVAETYRFKHFVGPELKIPDGYIDGGRSMKLAADGHASSHREVLVVDRANDVALQELLKFAKSDEVQALEPVARARRLAERVLAEGEFNDSDLSDTAIERMEQDYTNEPIKIGEVGRFCGAGVCRHCSLLFKILADEAGLRGALVRGNYGGSDGAHAWNEIHLEDGTKMIIDCMKLEGDLVLPENKAGRYLTVDNKPWYKKAAKKKDAK